MFDDFSEAERDFEAENARIVVMCRSKAHSGFHTRRIEDYESRIANFRMDPDKARMIAPTQGLITKERADLQVKLDSITRRRITDTSTRTLCVGAVMVE